VSVRAITHTVPDVFAQCQTTHIERVGPDLERARVQWRDYCRALESVGYEVDVLEGNRNFPDAPFVEDAAVVVGDLAIRARIGTPSRLKESQLVMEYLSHTHRSAEIHPPGFLDGGDILRVGKHFFVGSSGRTNQAGFEQFRRLVTSEGYRATAVPMKDCLHLKTGCTALDDHTILLNPAWVDRRCFTDYRVHEVEATEPFAANVLRTPTTLFVALGSPKRTALLNSLGYSVIELDISEFEKAEAGLTCLSILVDQGR
jgi:dimethylargininase